MTNLYFREKNMYIDWQLSDVCNFGCAYCNFESRGGIHGWPTFEQATKLVDDIVAHSDHVYRTYNLLGGEPTLWRDFGPLCEYIRERDSNSIIQVLTNGSRTVRWWEKYAPVMDKIVISHHVKISGTTDHVVDVVRTCYPVSNVSVQILVDHKCFGQVSDHFDQLISALPGISITPKKGETELGSGEWMPYTWEQGSWFERALMVSRANLHNHNPIPKLHHTPHRRELWASDGVTEWKTSNKEIIIGNHNHFEGWSCNIGKDMIAIKSSGEIHPASACFNEVSMGNYRKGEQIEWPQQPFICKYEGCYCGADIEVEKHAPK